ncbi:hypothetical protein RRG08_013104 [Elysia crispata]|uniref:Uncharacterized protein n=1 Tax=Elysia crispata TaxID=231223 RepID=A0AAE1A039_9GAST|nr:hypothetical protein RRG08_013104 [Elysia crispata]
MHKRSETYNSTHSHPDVQSYLFIDWTIYRHQLAGDIALGGIRLYLKCSLTEPVNLSRIPGNSSDLVRTIPAANQSGDPLTLVPRPRVAHAQGKRPVLRSRVEM